MRARGSGRAEPELSQGGMGSDDGDAFGWRRCDDGEPRRAELS